MDSFADTTPTTSGLANAYQTDGPVAATAKLNLRLSAGKFSVGSGNSIVLCDDGNSVVATGTVDAGGQTATLTLSTPLASGKVYTFQSASTCGTNYIQYDLTDLTAGTVVTLSVQSPEAPAANASATVATIEQTV